MKHATTKFTFRLIAMLVSIATLLGTLIAVAIPSIGAVTAADDPDLYLSMNFDPDVSGMVYTGGSVVREVTGLYGAPLAIAEDGKVGYSLHPETAAIIRSIDYRFNEGSSISLWVNGKAGDPTSVLFAKGDKMAGHFEVYSMAGALRFYSPDLGDHDMGYNMNTLDDGWHYLVFSRKDGQLITYADGAQVASVPLSGEIAEMTADFAVGALTENSLIFAAAIDSVCLYNRLLTDEEIAENAVDNGPEVDPNPYISVDFEPDNSGNVFTGGVAALPVTGLFDASLAVVEGGHGHTLACGTAALLSKVNYQFSEGHTISMWVYGSAADETSVLFSKGDKVEGHFEIYSRSGALYFYSPDINDYDMNFNMNTLGDGWHHLVFARKDGQLVTYADGQQVSSIALSGKIATTVADFVIGGLTDNTLMFAGSIDSVLLYNRLLSEDEIATAAADKPTAIPQETELETEPETDPETEPETDPETEPETDPETNPETDPATEPESDPATDPETDPATDPETNPATESDATTSPESTSETDQEDEGCKSIVAIPALALISLCGVCLLRKKGNRIE